jgi:hypothetical protein
MTLFSSWLWPRTRASCPAVARPYGRPSECALRRAAKKRAATQTFCARRASDLARRGQHAAARPYGRSRAAPVTVRAALSKYE